MATFKKEVSFISSILDGAAITEREVKKAATFNELNRRDKSQRQLQFALVAIFPKSNKDGRESRSAIDIDSNTLVSITEDAVKTLLVTDIEFTDTDKAEFLADNMALLSFGLWFLENHIIPFVTKLETK